MNQIRKLDSRKYRISEEEQMIMPLVSIICPIYNTEAYLKNTLDSILVQSYQNFELLLVDDGSTDHSLDICRYYAKKDNRVKVFHTENRGTAAARNYGLQNALGEHIAFVDSDDIVKETMIEQMVRAAVQTGEQIVMGGFWTESEHSLKSFREYVTKENPPVAVLPFFQYRIKNNGIRTTVWGAMFGSSLIRDMRFDEDLYIGEDAYFLAKALKKARSFAVIDDVYYYYSMRLLSVTHEKYDAKHETDITAWERVCDLYSDESAELQKEFKAKLGWLCVSHYEFAVKDKLEDGEMYDRIYQKARQYSSYIQNSDNFDIIRKVYMKLFLIAPVLAVKMKIAAKKLRSGISRKMSGRKEECQCR